MLSRITKTDLYRHDGLTGVKGFIKGWFNPGFRYTYVLRKTAQYKKNSFGKIFFKFLKKRYSFRYGYQISSDAQIDEGFYLTNHFSPVVIGPVIIGKNCNVGHSVTIGRTYAGGKVGRPTINDNVWIGANAVIVGNVNIGNNVLIAPNAYVNFDVPDNSLVIGNPGQIISKDNPTKYYINNIFCDE